MSSKFLAVVVMASTGCTSMQVQWGPVASAVPKQHPSHIRVALTDGGRRDVYDGDIVGDSLVGYAAAVGGAAQLDRVALALANVKRISHPVLDPGRTAALAAVLVVGTAALIVATTKCIVGTYDPKSGNCRGGWGLDGLDGI